MSSQVLTDRAMLVTLSISRWSARKYDDKISREAALQHGVSNYEEAGRYNKILISKDDMKPIVQFVSETRTNHEARTLPWSDKGPRILAAPGYFDYLAWFDGRQQAWESIIDEFVTNYEQRAREAEARLNGMFKASDYPPASMIREKFGMAMYVLPIPDEADFRVSTLGADEVEKIKADIKARLEEELATAAKDPWDRIHRVVSRVASSLKEFNPEAKGKDRHTFRDTVVTNLIELTDILPGLNLNGDTNLEIMRQRLVDELSQNTAQDLREDEFLRKDTAEAADDILQQMATYTGSQS